MKNSGEIFPLFCVAGMQPRPHSTLGDEVDDDAVRPNDAPVDPSLVDEAICSAVGSWTIPLVEVSALDAPAIATEST